MEMIRKTIGEMIRQVAEAHPNNEALVHTEIGIRYPYALLSWEVGRVARGLIQIGIQKGDRIALWSPNIPEWIIAQLALAKIGAIMVPVDPQVDREDLLYILEQSQALAIIMARGVEADEFVDTMWNVRDHVPSLKHIIVSGTETYPETIPWPELAAMGDDIPLNRLEKREEKISPEDPVAIMYTSGTTGRPKGVVLDHTGLINKSVSSARRQGLTHDDRLCLFFPLYHIFGNTSIALSGLLSGATLVIPCVSFDPNKVHRTLLRERCTALYGSPSMVIGLLNHPEFSKKKWNTVTKGILGGAPCPMDLMSRLVEDMGVSHITVGYGITETSSLITMTHPEDSLQLKVSTIGTPLEGNHVKIVSPATGEGLPPNTQGEICVRGLLMKEYYRMPAATAAAIDRHGWFHSGDLGEVDEKGYVKIRGRLKDVIVRNGVEISSTELEGVVYGLPQVSEVQVFGFPHPEKGQEIALWVKPREGKRLSIKTLTNFVREHVSEEKLPGHIKLVSRFPMTRSGKIQKFRLAEMAEKEYLKA